MAAASSLEVRKVAEADFPTEYGHFRIHGFEGRKDGAVEEAVAVVMGELCGPGSLLVRIHSQCLTGDVFHSLRCDCRAQLELSLEKIAAEKRGMVLYEKKEGRGIGLLNKLRAYALQDRGRNTVHANQELGLPVDARDYSAAGDILKDLGVKSLRLLTNNPDKVRAMEHAGLTVVERVPIVSESTPENASYLRTKEEELGHLFGDPSSSERGG